MSDQRQSYTCTWKHDGVRTCGGTVYKCGRCRQDYCVKSGGHAYHGVGKCCER
jgi:hypothetical protein